MENHDVNLGHFNNSMNFIFGLTGSDLKPGPNGEDPQIDIENNPYVKWVGLERKDGRVFYSSYQFEKCKRDFLNRFVLDHAVDWYPQPLCFKDRDNVEILNSWMYEEYSFPVVTLAYCRNTTENQNWCKSHEEIHEWLKHHVQYFTHQQTSIMSDIWEDHAIV